MKTLNCLIIAVLTAAVTSITQVRAATILPGQGLQFSQIDFTFAGAPQTDSAYGLAAVDISALSSAGGMSSGFLNIYSEAGWVVQNMPVDSTSGYPGLSAMFNLGVSHGVNVTTLNVAADYSPTPLASFSGSPTTAFSVGAISYNAEGFGGPVNLVPPPPITPTIPWVIGGVTRLLWEPTRLSVEQDKNQCAPASVANSLQWLESKYGINVPHDHVPGINGNPPNSLVGQLDKTMHRPPHQTVTVANFMLGKLEYIAKNGLSDDLVVKHWGGTLALGDYTYSGANSETSKDEQNLGLNLVEWIQKEIEHGEDVELVVGGHHVVNVTGAGDILGIPWISWVHDANQGYDTNGTALNGGNNWWDGGYGISTIRDGKLDFFLSGWTPDFAVSESVPEPSTLALSLCSVSVLYCYLVRRKLKGQGRV